MTAETVIRCLDKLFAL